MPFKVASTLGDIAAAAIAIVSAHVNHTQSLYILKELLARVCFQPRPWLSGAGLSGLRFIPYLRVVEMKLLIFQFEQNAGACSRDVAKPSLCASEGSLLAAPKDERPLPLVLKTQVRILRVICVRIILEYSDALKFVS